MHSEAVTGTSFYRRPVLLDGCLKFGQRRVFLQLVLVERAFGNLGEAVLPAAPARTLRTLRRHAFRGAGQESRACNTQIQHLAAQDMVEWENFMHQPFRETRDGSAQYLLLTEALDSLQTKAVTRILNGTARMSKMVDDLLDFTRTRLGNGQPLVRGPGDLGKICRQVVDELEAFHPGRTLHLHCSGDLLGWLDTRRIGQLVAGTLAAGP